VAEEGNDRELQAAALFLPSMPLAYVGPLTEGLVFCDRGMAICAADPELGATLLGYGALARLLQFRAAILARMGRLAEARADAERALTLARPRGELETVSWTLALLPQLGWLGGEGEGEEALALAAEAVRLGEDTGNVMSLVLGLEGLAVAHLAAGRPAEAVTACERALAKAREHRSGLCEEAALLAHLARARLATGDPSGATHAAAEAVTVARRQGARVVECLALLTRAQVHRVTGGGHDAVLGDVEAALSLVAETGALTYEPFIREEIGRLRTDGDELREALRLYTAIGATGHAERLAAELAGSPPARRR
jgi:tetratricopeptide (TPR) repeat protein